MKCPDCHKEIIGFNKEYCPHCSAELSTKHKKLLFRVIAPTGVEEVAL